MHKRNSIVNIPLLIGSVLSIAIHVAALYSRGIYTPPKPALKQGRTVVHLTLIPAVASQAATPELPADKPIEQTVETENPIPVATVVEPVEESHVEAVDSPERDASLIEEKGVITEAQASKTISPVYPRISRRRGEEGVVVISVQILANGKVDSIKIIKSSGYQRLDKAAQNAAWATLFTPAKRLGQNVDSSTELSFAFRLTDD